MSVVLEGSANPGTATWGSAQSIVTARIIVSPGGAVPVTTSLNVPIILAGAELASTLDIPTFAGQLMTFYCVSSAPGTRAVDVSSAIDSAGHTHINFSTAGESITLIGCVSATAGTLAWTILQNNMTAALT